MDFFSGIATGVALGFLVAVLTLRTSRREKRYHYYVSFYIIAGDNSTGFGSLNLTRSLPLDSLSEMQSLGETIRRDQGAKGVTILNVQKMDS